MALLLVSCDRETFAPESETIKVKVTASNHEDAPLTKGKTVSGTDFNSIYTSFDLSGFVNDGVVRSEAPGGVYFTNCQVSRVSSKWTLASDYLWFKDVPMTFWAVAPHALSGITNLTWTANHQGMSFDYELPAPTGTGDAVAQQDILVSKKGITPTLTSELELTFDHALACIRIDTTYLSNIDPGYRVTGVTFKGIKSSAHCDVTEVSSSLVFTWGSYGAAKSYGQSFIDSDFGSDGKTLSTSDKFFMFIPQTSADDAEIWVSYKNTKTGLSGRVKASIKGKTWAPGKMYTYQIQSVSSSLIVKVVDEVDSNVKKNLGIRNKGTVTSYMRLLMVGNWINTTTDFVVAPWTDSSTEGTFVGLNTTDWVKGSDGFWYLHDPVVAGDYAPDLFDTYTPVSSSSRKLQLTISVQSVPATSDKSFPKAVWGDYTATYLN